MYIPIFEEIILILSSLKNSLSKEEYKTVVDRAAKKSHGRMDNKMLNDLKVTQGKIKRGKVGK